MTADSVLSAVMRTSCRQIRQRSTFMRRRGCRQAHQARERRPVVRRSAPGCSVHADVDRDDSAAWFHPLGEDGGVPDSNALSVSWVTIQTSSGAPVPS